MKITRFVAGLVAVVALAQTVSAQPRARARAGQGGIAAIKQHLELSDAQVQQLTALRREEGDALASIREQIREKAQALGEARSATNPDPTAVGQLTLELQRMREQVRAVNREYHEKALAILDASQRAKLEALEGVTRRAVAARPAAAGAAALNLMLPLDPPRPPAGVTP